MFRLCESRSRRELHLISIITSTRSCCYNFKEEEIKVPKNYGTFQKLHKQENGRKALKQYFTPQLK